jgi:phage repressor protein C with HTH and peptisase S24 domain
MQEKQQEKSPIKQNILLYLANKGVTPYEFYKVSGVTRGILQQSNGISEDNIARFLAYAPDVNIEWLITGKGDMLKNDNAGCQRQIEPAHHVPENIQEGIPLIPLSAMAGAFTGDTSVMEYECERYVIPAFKGADFLIQVKGDSMQPTYYSGDLVACQRVPLNDLFFQWNKTYVLDTAQGPLIKRIRRGSDDEHILIVSDNTEYEPFELSKSQFHGVALVRGLVRLE